MSDSFSRGVRAPKSVYVDWIRAQGDWSVREAAGTWWRYCRGAVIPAVPFPVFATPTRQEARFLLGEVKGLFVRSTPALLKEEESDFWYMVADRYDFEALSKNMRNQIRRGQRACRVERIDATWLAVHGYACHVAASTRYAGAQPMSRELFERGMRGLAQGPYEVWGVFVEGMLGAYCHCIVDGECMALNTFVIDPGVFPAYPAYALLHALMEEYISRRGMRLSNGTRPVVHDTNFQDFLLKFGWRRLFCGLRMQYAFLAGMAMRCVYPFRRLVERLPGARSVKSVLWQEEIARKTTASGLCIPFP